MAEQMKTMNTNVSTLTNKVEEIESKPAKKWEAVVEKVLLVVVGAVVAFALTQIGL